jgi:RNA polymerase sigma factor (sigma-70 family)
MPITIRKLAGAAAPEATDRELLARYIADHDDAAFAALVHRHGTLVWNVRRRTLRRHQDAEDVFQATFLVLARKAGAIGWRKSVAPGLYAVARLACKARAEVVRRPNASPLESCGADPLEEMTARELLTALDEEVAALPEKYRGPIVLCWLEDNTQAEAARLLHLSLSTVRRRLEYGRKILHTSLTRRGLALPELLGAVTLARAEQTVPAVALAVATGRAPASAQALRFAEMLLLSTHARLKAILAVLLAGGVAMTGFGLATTSTPQQPSGSAKGVDPAALRAAEAEPLRKDFHGDPLPPGALARMGTVRLKHRDRFFAATFAPDGKTLVSLGYDRRLRVWDMPSGRQRWQAERQGLESGEPLFLVSPDSKKLAAYLHAKSDDVWLLDLETGKELCKLSGVSALAFSPDGRVLALKDKGTIRLHDPGTGRATGLLTDDAAARFRHAAFTGDGKSLVAVDEQACVRVWDVSTAKVTRRFTPPPARPVSERPNREGPDVAGSEGKVVALAMKDAGFVVWDVATDKERFRLPQGRGTLVFSADGKRLACSTGESSVVVDVATGEIVSKVSGDEAQLVAALSADGKTLVTAGYQSFLCLWDADTGKRMPRQPEHQVHVGAVAFSPSGRMLATASEDDTVRLWDAATGRHLLQITRKRAFRLGRWVFFSPEGKTVAAQHELQSFAHYDAATGESAAPKYVQQAVGTVVPSPDGRVLVVAETNYGPETTLHLVDAGTHKELRSITAPCKETGGRSYPPDQIVFSPDGRLLAVSDFLHTIRLYDTGTGKEVRQIVDGSSPETRTVMVIAFSPDGRILASAGGGWGGRWGAEPRPDNGFCLWDVATGNLLLKRGAGDHPFEEQALVQTVAFAPDGRTLATGGMDGLVRVWEVATGRELGHFEDEGNKVYHVAFSPDGEKLASAMDDGSTLIWDWGAAGLASATGEAECGGADALVERPGRRGCGNRPPRGLHPRRAAR